MTCAKNDPEDEQAREIANIQLEMDGILERVVWLLCPGLRDGTEKLAAFSTVQQRALHLLAAGILVDDQRADIVEAAIRWLQLAAKLVRMGAPATCPTADPPSEDRD